MVKEWGPLNLSLVLRKALLRRHVWKWPQGICQEKIKDRVWVRGIVNEKMEKQKEGQWCWVVEGQGRVSGDEIWEMDLASHGRALDFLQGWEVSIAELKLRRDTMQFSPGKDGSVCCGDGQWKQWTQPGSCEPSPLLEPGHHTMGWNQTQEFMVHGPTSEYLKCF